MSGRISYPESQSYIFNVCPHTLHYFAAYNHETEVYVSEFILFDIWIETSPLAAIGTSRYSVTMRMACDMGMLTANC
jgi:hypothetical protein